MANADASILPMHERAMPFLAHLVELRRRIFFQFLEYWSDFFSAGPTRIGYSV
jgi:hypothetical protein